MAQSYAQRIDSDFGQDVDGFLVGVKVGPAHKRIQDPVAPNLVQDRVIHLRFCSAVRM